jgi:hypothetical protein
MDILREMKVLLSLDERLVRRIDRAARSMGLSRSAYVARLAATELESTRGAGASAASRSALRRLDGLFASHPQDEGTVAIRAERDAR